MSVIRTKVFHTDTDVQEVLVSGKVPVLHALVQAGDDGWDEVPTGHLVVREISGLNTNGAGLPIYVQIYDSATIPAPGSTHMKFAPVKVADGARFDIVFDKELYPMSFIFENGLYIAASSDKYTLALQNGMDVQVLFDERTT
jgi:hypothetical protein